MPAHRKKRILVAPLNWGLGHASRCIPVVERLRAHGAEAVLAADGRPFDFLRQELPDAELHRLEDISITYHAGSSMAASIVRQLPHIVSSYRRERRSIGRMTDDLRIDGIISDGRFGLFSRDVPCAYMTHQVSIMPPAIVAWMEPLLRRAHEAITGRFTECWIPDSPDAVNLSGSLAHGMPLASNMFYIGPLSRLSAMDIPQRYDCAVVLSGPEPQRTLFESIILRQLAPLDIRAIVVRGIPGTVEPPDAIPGQPFHGKVEIVGSLAARELNEVMNASACIVARSGYSTIMDLAALGKKAVLVPTPGQTEQEYLALRLKEMNIFYSERQEEFDLARSLEQSRAFSGWNMQLNGSGMLDARIEHFLSLITL